MERAIPINYVEEDEKNKIEIKGTVTIKRLNFAEKNSLEEESTKITFLGDVQRVDVSTARLKELAVFKSVVRWDLRRSETKDGLGPIVANIPLSLQSIKELPSDLGELLFEKYNEFNSLTPKKKEISS